MTPAIRAAERAGVRFTVHAYNHDGSIDSYALEAATKLGVESNRLFKTLVARTDAGRLVIGLVPAAARLDLKRLAAAVGAKRAEMADPAAAERATGYVVGGISPLGGRQRLLTVLDASAGAYETVFVSAGRRGLQIEVSPADLLILAAATSAAISAV